jgi:hypothetical protein
MCKHKDVAPLFFANKKVMQVTVDVMNEVPYIDTRSHAAQNLRDLSVHADVARDMFKDKDLVEAVLHCVRTETPRGRSHSLAVLQYVLGVGERSEHKRRRLCAATASFLYRWRASKKEVARRCR